MARYSWQCQITRTRCRVRKDECFALFSLNGPLLIDFRWVHNGYRPDASVGSASGRPSRISFEKSGESLAARARVSIRLRAFSSVNGSPLVTMKWRSYNNSSPLPLSRMRQSHGTRSLGGCCVRMLVVQLVVMALYQRGLARRALSEWMYSRKRSRACAGEMVVR